MRERDNTPRTGAQDPWGREAGPLAQRPAEARTSLDSGPGQRSGAEAGEGHRKPHCGAGMLGASFTAQPCGKALSDRLALKPYWGRSSRQDYNPAGESPAVSNAQSGHVAMPHPGVGNQPGDAWCKRPSGSAPVVLRSVQSGGLASVGA